MTPLYKVFMPTGLEEILPKIVYSGKLTYGEYARRFEDDLKSFIDNPLTLTTSNNNYAALIALDCLDINKGDEVITSPMACLASNQPLLSTGAKIVWADIDPSTGTLDPTDVRKRITSKTKAILHYHWCGYPGYIDEINQLGREFGVYTIDDAIESFGAEYKGRKMGNCGSDVTLFSFQAVRLPNTIDGGAISFKNKELYERALRMRDWGIDRNTFRDEFGEISSTSDIKEKGYNAMMGELNGAIGTFQIRKLPSLLAIQNENSRKWDELLEESNLKRIKRRKDSSPNYWVYSCFSKNLMDEIKKYRELGFYASKVHLRNDNYSCFGKGKQILKGVEEFEKTQFSLPCGWWFNKIIC